MISVDILKKVKMYLRPADTDRKVWSGASKIDTGKNSG